VYFKDNGTIAGSNQTEKNGQYIISNLSAGNYTITTSSIYFEEQSKDITLLENGTQEVNFIITPLDSDGDTYPDYIDAYPFDPYKWKEISPDDDEKPEEASKGADSASMFICLPILVVGIIVILLVIAFYTRLKSRRLLEHQTRDRIYTHIQANPGVHYRGIMNELELSMGVLTHHLNMLERQNYIKSMQDGNFRRFYSKDQTINTQLLLNQPQESILNAIKSNPGISQSKLATELNMTKKTVYYNVNQLKDSGLVYVDRAGRESECFYAGET
jgi:DNA-binding MarR family transcriptional regulator